MKYFLAIIFFFSQLSIYAQVDSLPSYFIDREQVVLEFDVRNYANGQEKDFSKIFEVEGEEVINCIDKNKEWSKDGWALQKINTNIYQLRKDLDAFNVPFFWHDKYKLKGDYWVEPTSELENISGADPLQKNFKPEPKTAVISAEGNTPFQLAGFKDAKKVILAGSFNHWKEHQIRMTPNDSGWEITLDLAQGIYEYKFIVDGDWMEDPANPLKIMNQHHTWNSILLVGETVTFKLANQLDAQKVILSGSFNNWNEHAFPMKKRADGWYTDIPLPPGKHYYKFIVDEKWMLDPENKLQQPDQQGYWNSVLLIH